jgi:lipopolysaccharide biosynthesis protein
MSWVEVLALYLPQYHPIPENDEWWGRGFTEWTNVTKARPLFRGHVQPHLPADLGFYDLRLAEARAAQAELAGAYGITGFCYWHYWFAGRRLLQRPLDEVISSATPDFPFCVAWANQSWRGIWHGAPKRVLIEQTYPGPDDDRAHFENLLPAFSDERYINIDGRPMLFIYKPEELPEPARFVETWQKMAADAGLKGLYLVASLGESKYAGHVEDGFDAAVYYRFPFGENRQTWLYDRLLGRRLVRGPRRYPYPDQFVDPPAHLDGPVFPAVYPNWDNTPRLGRRGFVATGATPQRFGAHMRRALELAARLPDGEQVVVIKSWNEWAEGNYLEPDREFGNGRLEALAAAVGDARR